MQNRRILNSIFQQQNIEVRPAVVTNSFLVILSHLRAGDWASIVPHTFAHLFGEPKDIAMIPLVEPLHMQSVGLVTSDRHPQPPLAQALEACARGLDMQPVLERGSAGVR
jgi:DNA-binding transcriptional LysR family regulator